MDPQKLLRRTGVPETHGLAGPVLCAGLLPNFQTYKNAGGLHSKFAEISSLQSGRVPQLGSLLLSLSQKTVEFCQNVFAKLDIFSESKYNMDSYKVCLWL